MFGGGDAGDGHHRVTERVGGTVVDGGMCLPSAVWPEVGVCNRDGKQKTNRAKYVPSLHEDDEEEGDHKKA
jgi:hypothetical protein